jgi:omega-amidase
MRLSIIQTALTWEQPETNRQHFARLLAPLAGQTDLIVLPEMFTTGFSMNAAALAEPTDGPTAQWMLAQARQLDAAVVGSFICAANGAYTNRLFFALPDGQSHIYDKKHLFGMAGEDQHYIAGNEVVIVTWKGWRIRPLICYDLRFPVWSRNQAAAPYDLLLFIANWPQRRAHHWRALLQARAIENQSFIAGVNIVGTDGAGYEYLGDSMVVEYSGQTLAHLAGSEAVVTVTLDKNSQQQYRQQLPFLADADPFRLD